MAKESSDKTPRELSKKHLARVEKENRQKKILLYAIIAIIVVIVGLIGYGILNNTVLKDSRPVAKVGKTTITVKQFEDRVRYERYQEVQTFVTYASSYFASFFQSQLTSLQSTLDSYVQFGSTTLDQMIGEAALVQKAKSMGITVTDAEVEAEIQSNLQYYPSGTPTAAIPTATITYYPTATLSDLQKTLTARTSTPTAMLTETPISTESATVSGTPAEGTTTAEGTAASTTATVEESPTATVNLTPSVTATITPTATAFTSEGYKNLYSTVIANVATSSSFSEQELREYVRTTIYERKIYNKLAADVAPEQDMVWARHILVATKAEADDIETKLKNGGDFAALAAQYSTDTSNNTTGGDLGWFAKGTMVKAFEDVAFATKIGDTSDPVQTDYGYHIIQVLGHEKRQLTADELTTAQKAAYNTFITDAKTALGVTKYDVWASVVPSEPTIPTDYRISTGTDSGTTTTP